MTKRIARVATLLAMIVWSWIPPQPALAQLLPPLPIVSSLIVTVTASWGLDADGVVAPKGGDPRIQRTTANLMNRFGAFPQP